MSEPVVEVSGIKKTYGKTVAVQDMDFQVQEGEFFSLLGPSGCGKTTTLRMIAGFEVPTAGNIYIQGEEVSQKPPNDRDTGMVFQGYALFPHKTVGENVGFGLKMEGVEVNERKERVAEILELVDLGGYEDRYPKELSGGQQQRVALARALVIEPSVLLLDEPLSSLDLKLRQRMRFEIKQIQNELDITTIYVTHDQEEALQMSDRILVMEDGKEQQISKPHAIYNEPVNKFVADFIGEANLIAVNITEIGDEQVFVEIPTGQTIPVSKDRVKLKEINRNDTVLLNIRPEDIRIQADDEAVNAITGTVQAKTFIGKSTKILVEVDGSEVMVDVTGRRSQTQFETGQTISLYFDQENCTLLSEQVKGRSEAT